MALLRKRDRMISIRLSDEEFQRVKEACRASGARSVSDMARDAMRHFVGGPGAPDEAGDDGLTARLEELDDRVRHLQTQVSRLKQLVGVRER